MISTWSLCSGLKLGTGRREGGGEGASEVLPLQNRGRWNLSHAKGGVE